MASSSHPTVTDTILNILHEGRNAADAGIAGFQAAVGVFSALVLGILCHLGIPSAEKPPESAEALYFLSHALRLADQELGYLNDPAVFDVPVDCWLSPDYHAMRAEILARSRPRVDLSAHVRAIGGPPTLAAAGLPTGSCELSIVDAEGNWLQMMNTLQSGGIPGVTLDGVPMYGCHAQSSRRYFIGGWFGGGGRIRSPIGNTIVLRGGEPWLALGTPGNVFATVPQVLSRILDAGAAPEDAIDAPRMLPLRDDYVLEAESRLSPDALADLVRMGIRYKPLPGFDVHMGSFQASWRDPDSGSLSTYADPRRPGKADGL